MKKTPKQGLASLAILLALGACQRDEPAQAPDTAPASVAARSNAATAPWFLCDSLETPSVYVVAKSDDGRRALLTEYSKADGRPAWRGEYDIGPGDGAAGSVFTPLMRGQQQAGNVRQINPGMLENPGSAFTTPYTSITLGERTLSCRWLARTRVMGFDERRTFVVHEDADGDLIYSTYDFSSAATQRPVDLAENSRTTGFSVEVRGGTETTGPGGSEYRFENGEILYIVTVPAQGPANVEVWRGDNQIQSEMLIAQQIGTGG